MLKLIIKQANWGVIGSIFGLSIGFLIKIYIIDIVGVDVWGKYVSAHAFAMAAETFLSIGIPWILIKYFPSYLKDNIPSASQLISKIIRYVLFLEIPLNFFDDTF